MVGLIGNLAKGALSKPKQQKVSSQQLTKDVDNKKDKSSPKGALVPSLGGGIVKIIDVKAPVKKDFVTGGDPALEQMKIINTKTFDIIKALKGQQVSKKKKSKTKKNLFQWMTRKKREDDREGKEGGGLKLPLIGKVGQSAGNLLSAILKTLAILFAGWLTKYLPQIIETVRKFVDIVGKILNFVKPIAILLFDIGKWIVTNGTKLAAKLVGVDPKIIEENSIIQNLNEIQKRFPLLEAAFAAFLVYKGIGGIKKITQPRGNRGRGSGGQNLPQGQGGNRFNAQRSRLRTSSATQQVRNRFARRFGGDAARRRFAGNVGGRVVSRSQRLMTGLRAGASKSKALLGKVGKIAKLPVIGGLVVAVTQLIAGEPLGKALFMGVGAGIGGILGGLIGAAGGPLAVVGSIMGEMLGTFVGELLYEGFMGKGWGAAGEKLKETLGGIWKNVGKPLVDWVKGVFSTFIEKFKKENKIFGQTNWINILNPLITAPLLFKSFFASPKDDGVKRNIIGVEMKDQGGGSTEVDVEQTTDAGDLEFTGTSDTQSSNANAIGESASYDKVEGGDTIIISSGGGAIPSGGGGGGSSLSLVGGSDFHRAAQLNRKKSNLAKVWA
jgi:hypothetical protein